MNFSHTIGRLALILAPLALAACSGNSSSASDPADTEDALTSVSHTISFANDTWFQGDARNSNNLEAWSNTIDGQEGAFVNPTDTYRIVNGDSVSHDFSFGADNGNVTTHTIKPHKTFTVSFSSAPVGSLYIVSSDNVDFGFNVVAPPVTHGPGPARPGCESQSQGMGFTSSDCESPSQGFGFN